MTTSPRPACAATTDRADGPSGSDAGSTPHRPALRRDAERNRQRILAAARELFAERGIDVTLDDIARHAELGVGTVYRRFPSREHLVEALFEERIGAIVDVAGHALEHADPWQGLVNFLVHAGELIASDRGLHDIMFSSVYGQDAVARARERIGPLVSRLVARAQATGDLRADVRPTDIPMIQFVVGSVVEYVWQSHPDLWRRYLAIIIDGLRTRRDEQTALPCAALDDAEFDDVMRSWRPGRRPATQPGDDQSGKKV